MNNTTPAQLRPLLDSKLRLVPQRPRSKRPLTMPGTASVWPVESPDDVADVLRLCPEANWALSLDTSGLVVIDIDGEGGIPWLGELGVTSSARVWVQRRVGAFPHIYYRRPPGTSGRFPKLGPDIDVDFLASGLVTVPPSVHEAGGRYRWVVGKSPAEFGPDELDLPPSALTDVWLAAIRKREQRASVARPVSAPAVPRWSRLSSTPWGAIRPHAVMATS